MNRPAGPERAEAVRRMFDRIARRYDLMNRLMTFGQDIRWRRKAVRRLSPVVGGRYLDLGAGTGDLAFEILDQAPAARVVAADFSREMMAVGRRRRGAAQVAWVVCDALRLPFASGSFAGVVSGFLMRNVIDVDECLQEQQRVLAPGGRAVTLDTTPPASGPFKPLVELHFQRVIPVLGRWVAGDAEAYRYLPDSTASFLPPEKLADRFQAVGFGEVGFARWKFWSVGIHWGSKSPSG
jgi:demethylmenaquinone methyltransferase/2-methoxy-6-polyprenyl-1,4-benzoquinol methylase